MHTFSGQSARVYLVGEPFHVQHVPFRDCDGGWNWCAADSLHCWEGDVEFEIWRGVWERINPVEVFHRSGVAVFPRCLEGSHLRASGVCRPTSLLAKSKEWKLNIQTVSNVAQVIGGHETPYRHQTLGASVVLEDVVCGSEEGVLALLPFATGAFNGCGNLTGGLSVASVYFNDEGVLYEPARPECY